MPCWVSGPTPSSSMLMCKTNLEKPHLELTVKGLQGHKHQVQPCSSSQAFHGTDLPGQREQYTCSYCCFDLPQMQIQRPWGLDEMYSIPGSPTQRPTLESVQSHPAGSCSEEAVPSNLLIHTTHWEHFWGRSSHQLFAFIRRFCFLRKRQRHAILTARAWCWFSPQGLTRQTPMCQ